MTDKYTFGVRVPCLGRTTINQLLQVSRQNWVTSEICDRNFPYRRLTPREVNIDLFNFGRLMAVANILAEFARREIRPTNVAELLALSAQFPSLQNSCISIVSLGNNWHDSFRRAHVVCLDVCRGVRRARLVCRDGLWGRECWFGAVCGG